MRVTKPLLVPRHQWWTGGERRTAGTPYGNRTRVSAVKGRRPRPLDEGRTAVADQRMQAGYRDVRPWYQPLNHRSQNFFA